MYSGESRKETCETQVEHVTQEHRKSDNRISLESRKTMTIVCPLFLRKFFPDSIKIRWKSLPEKFMRTCWKLKLAISSVAKFHLIGNAVSVLIGFFISFRIGFPRCMSPSYHEDQTIPFEEGLRLIPRRPLSNSFETYPKK